MIFKDEAALKEYMLKQLASVHGEKLCRYLTIFNGAFEVLYHKGVVELSL